MASPCCWSCLKLRPSPRAILPPTSFPRGIAPFHASASRYRLSATAKRPKPQTLDNTPRFRASRSTPVKKKKPAPIPRYFGEERRAIRERVVLSNTNALEVVNMKDLSLENMADMRLRGQVMGIPMPLIDRMRGLQAFKPSQGWSMFRRPGALMRRESLEMGRLIQSIQGGEEKGKAFVRVVRGNKGTGKSLHLVKAMTMGLMNDWIVVNVPQASEIVVGSSSYAPLAGSNPTQYVQKDVTVKMLSRIAEGNKDVLSKLHISQPHALKLVQKEMSLYDLANAGIKQPEQAWNVFKALWSEMTATEAAAGVELAKPFEVRPPMMVTVDSIQHWMINTQYRNPEYKFIHAHEFTMVDHFLSLANPSSLPNGGLVLYATTKSTSVRSVQVSLNQIAARNAGIEATSPDFPLPDPYEKLDDRVLSFFRDNGKDIKIVNIGNLNKDETRGLMEYYALSGILRETVNETSVGEKWSLAGGGVIAELQRMGKRLRVGPPPLKD